MLQLSFLGPFQVILPGYAPPKFSTNKVRALLAYLAVENGRAHERAALVGLFWPGMPEVKALNNLSKALGLLRQALCERDLATCYLVSSRQAVRFNPEGVYWLDVAEFQQGVAPQTSVPQLEQAVAFYQGEFLTGFSLHDTPAFEEWLLLWRERLHQQMLGALERLAHHYLASGNYKQAQRHARRQLELDAWREVAHVQLMRALAMAGDHSGALAQYESCRHVLASELGVEPDPSTTALYEQIKAGIMGEKMVEVVPWHNLPAALTPLLGREAEVDHLVQRLQDPAYRLVTLTGEGGSGKTRLALAVGERLRQQYCHGVWFVPLAGVRADDAKQIAGKLVTAVAGALDFSLLGREDPTRQLFNFLRHKELLLLLDNFEHLLANADLKAAANFVVELLQAAPKAKVLVTSRVRLNLRAESLFMLQGLPVPAVADASNAATYSSIQLFVALAQRLQANVILERDLAAISQICRLVEGLPLGIELAANWSGSFTCAEIADAIQGNVDFLTTEYHDVPERQRSLRAAFDYSWRLLSSAEQRLLAQLSIFRGGFSRQAVIEVVEAALVDLVGLVSNALVRAISQGRYEIHERIRQFASEKLASLAESIDLDTAVRQRHSAFYLAAVADGGEPLTEARIARIRQTLRVELDNIHQAWAWAVRQGNLEAMHQAAPGLSKFFYAAGLPRAGERAMQQAIERLEQIQKKKNQHRLLPATMAALLTEQAFHLNAQAQSLAASVASRRAFELAQVSGNASISVRASLEEVHALRRLGDYESSRMVAQRGALLAQASGFNRLEADRLTLLAYSMIQQHHGVFLKVRELFEKSLSLYQAVDDQPGQIRSLTFLSGHYELTGYLSRAKTYRERVLQLSQTMGNPWTICTALLNVGGVYAFLGDYLTARGYFQRSLDLADDLHHLSAMAYALDSLSQVYGYMGEVERALLTSQQAQAVAQAVDDRPLLIDIWLHRAYVLFDEGAWAEAAEAACQALSLAQALDHTPLSLQCQALQGGILLAQGQAQQALARIEPVVEYLVSRDHILVGVFEVFKSYGLCYDILAAAGDPPTRASNFLSMTQGQLQTWAERIDDGAQRRCFLDNVTAHRRITAAVDRCGER